MNYWQFKFNMKKGAWDEFETITAGEKFSQSTTKNLLTGCVGDIVFYYRSDKNRGIYFIAEIISEPYSSDYNLKYAIDLRIIKRLDNYIDYEDNFSDLHDYYNTAEIRKRVQPKELIKDKFNPQSLYNFLMKDSLRIKVKDSEIDKNILEDTEKLKQKYIDNGYLFNAFHNLNLIRGEVKHLAFIGNLLNPYGNHFKEDLFLKYFIQSLLEYSDLKDNDILKNFINDNPNVTIEKTIKDKNDNNIGRVDLWLESDNYIIAIEGKIEAKDNKRQLKKYNEYLENQDKKYLLLYLTLRENETPANVNKDELSNFHLMNFEQDILEFIDNSINDENIKGNIESTLFDYKDALIKYMYNYHLSFEYSYKLIENMTKNENIFEKYQQIKEYYYQNKTRLKNSVYEDIAENFEYAKAYIELLFYKELKNAFIDEDMIFKSILSLDDVSKDLYLINKARMARIQPKIDDEKPEENDLGEIKIAFYTIDEEFYCSITNNAIGVIHNIINNDIDSLDLYKEYSDEVLKIDSDIFKSNNISKLLDKQYRTKLIKKVL